MGLGLVLSWTRSGPVALSGAPWRGGALMRAGRSLGAWPGVQGARVDEVEEFVCGAVVEDEVGGDSGA